MLVGLCIHDDKVKSKMEHMAVGNTSSGRVAGLVHGTAEEVEELGKLAVERKGVLKPAELTRVREVLHLDADVGCKFPVPPDGPAGVAGSSGSAAASSGG